MELVIGGLLIGASGMLVLFVVAAWKDSAPRRAVSHPPQSDA